MNDSNLPKRTILKCVDMPVQSNWQCYIFGTTDIVWAPAVGQVPNAFVRLMMRICFSCKWVKNNA